jgi:hypothetical protein
MFVNLDGQLLNLTKVRSISQDEDKVIFSFLADYTYEVKITFVEAVMLLKKSGVQVLEISDTDALVLDNVLDLTQDDDELSVIYQDGSDESFSDVEPINSEIQVLAELSEEDDEEELDSPNHEVIPADLQVEQPDSHSAIGVQILIVVVAVLVVAYQIYKMKH